MFAETEIKLFVTLFEQSFKYKKKYNSIYMHNS